MVGSYQDPDKTLLEWLRSLNESDEASALIPKVSDDVLQALAVIMNSHLSSISAYSLGRYATVVDDTTTANMIYICEAEPGTATSAASWRAKRIDV